MQLKKIGLILLIVCSSCSKDTNISFTGDLTVDAGATTGYYVGNSLISIDQATIGLYDPSVLTSRNWYSDAIAILMFSQGKLTFKGINFGNYVVSTTDGAFRKVVQVKAGATTTVKIFAP